MKDIIFPITYKYDDKGIKQAESGLTKLGNFAEKAGLAVVAGLAVATVAASAFAVESIKAASSFQETSNAINEVFGEAASDLQNFAKTASSALGQTRTQFLQGAKTFGIFGQAAGLADKENAVFSKNLASLASDLASFNDTSVDEAMTALGAALRGESEPIRRFGVLLDDARLKARALEMGIYDGNGALSQQQRVLAANAEIFAQTTIQQGDYARTSESASNAAKTLQAAIGDLKITVGEALLPAVEAVIPKITEFVNEMQASPDFKAFVDGLAGSFNDMLPKLIPVMENFGNLLLILLPGLNPLLDAMGSALGIISLTMPSVNEGGEEMFTVWGKVADVLSEIESALSKVDGFLNDIKISGVGMGEIIVSVFAGLTRSISPLVRLFENLWNLIQLINRTSIKPSGLTYNRDGSINRDGNVLTPFAKGGIVTGPTPALVGEAGPEAIIPLDRFDDVVGKRGGANVNIIVNAGMGTDGAAVGESIVKAIRKYERTSGPVFARA
jgi:hypothetical protein